MVQLDLVAILLVQLMITRLSLITWVFDYPTRHLAQSCAQLNDFFTELNDTVTRIVLLRVMCCTAHSNRCKNAALLAEKGPRLDRRVTAKRLKLMKL